MAAGWLKLHRKIRGSAVIKDAGLAQLWLWCLVRTNYCDAPHPSGRGILRAGQFYTDRFQGRDELGVKPTTWYKRMRRLENMKQIVMESDSNGTTVTVCNWSTYQSDDCIEVTPKGQLGDNPVTPKGQLGDNNNKELEEDKEGKEKDIPAPPAEPPKAADSVAAPHAEKPSPRKPPPPSGPHQQFLALFAEMWAARYPGEKYTVAGGKDGAAAKFIREQLGDDPARWREVIGRYLAEEGDFWHGHNLTKLRGELNRFKTPAPSSNGKQNGKQPEPFSTIKAWLANQPPDDAG